MENLRWIAQYNDGSTLSQIDADGTKHGYTDIDRSELQAFGLWHKDEARPTFTVWFDGDGNSLIWTRRIYHVRGNPEPRIFHIIGKRDRFIAAIADDTGAVIIRDNFIDDGLFDEVLQ